MSKEKKQATKHKHDFKRSDGQKPPHHEITYFCAVDGCDKRVVVVGRRNE